MDLLFIYIIGFIITTIILQIAIEVVNDGNDQESKQIIVAFLFTIIWPLSWLFVIIAGITQSLLKTGTGDK
jgi:hypothetical protein